jgi:glycosyltransferase involved in cell wall biosynthesis
MKILFVMGNTYVPELYAGTEMATHHLCLRLKARGHGVAVLCPLGAKGPIHLRNRLKSRLLRKKFPIDRILGYPVFRGYYPEHAWSDGFEEIGTSFWPDAIVFQSWNVAKFASICERFAPGRVFVWVHWFPREHTSEQIDPLACARLVEHLDTRLIANSPFTQQVLQTVVGVDAPIVRPVFGCSKYRSVLRIDPRNALFASVNRHKGIDTVLSMADARRDLSFVILDTWTANQRQRTQTERNIAANVNVSLRPARPNIEDVYASTRVLLMPSRGPETWGRMVTEAQSCGIPVLASREGNLIDTVGPGGICLDRDAPIERWIEALSRLMDDQDYYRNLSARALEWSRRAEVDEDVVVTEFESLLSSGIR